MDEGFAALQSKKSQEYRMHFKIFSRVRAENGSDGVRRLCIQVLNSFQAPVRGKRAGACVHFQFICLRREIFMVPS